MQSLKEIMAGPAISGFTGSETTRDMVAQQIAAKWGQAEVEKYNPYKNTLTFAKWLSLGYVVKRHEKALRSITIVEKKDKDGKVIKRFRKTICLFYCKQVEKAKV